MSAVRTRIFSYWSGRTLSRFLSLSSSLSPRNIKYQCTSDSDSAGDFFFWGKTFTVMGHFLWIFRGGLSLFDPKIALCYAQDNSGVKYCLYCFICFVCFALLVSVCLLLHVYGVCRLCCTANPPLPQRGQGNAVPCTPSSSFDYIVSATRLCNHVY